MLSVVNIMGRCLSGLAATASHQRLDEGEAIEEHDEVRRSDSVFKRSVSSGQCLRQVVLTRTVGTEAEAVYEVADRRDEGECCVEGQEEAISCRRLRKVEHRSCELRA